MTLSPDTRRHMRDALDRGLTLDHDRGMNLRGGHAIAVMS